ncbi:MAG: O-antigen ligase family protein [bacterium]|nr:O-antigen ligase family protein [bacterium]
MLKRLASPETSFFKYAVAALIMAIPLYPKFPLLTIPGSFVAIRLEDFLIAAIFLFWVTRSIRDRFSFLKDDLNKSIIAYFVIGFLSFVSALFITQSIVPHIGLLHTLRRVEYMAVFFIVVTSIRSMKEVIFYIEVLFLTLFLVFLYGIGQKFFLFPVISTMNTEFAKGIALRLHFGARVSSTFAGHYDLAAYLVLLLPVVMAVFMAAKKRLHQLFLALMFFLSFWLLLVSASRISFFAYLASIAFTLWFLKRKLWIVPVLALSIGASLLTPQLTDRYSQTLEVALVHVNQIKFTLPWDKQPTVVSFVPEVTPTPEPVPQVQPKKGVPAPVKKIRVIPTPTPLSGKRIVFYGAGDEMPQTEDRSLSIRLKVEWPRALRSLAKNPFLGTGFSSITLATDNDYLRALGEIGLLGFIAFTLILLKIALRTKNAIVSGNAGNFEKMLMIGLFGALLGFLGNALFIDVFEASKVAITFWLLMGILVGIAKLIPVKVKTK